MALSNRDTIQLLGPAEFRRAGDHVRVTSWGKTRNYVERLLQERLITIIGEDIDEVAEIIRKVSPRDTLIFSSLDSLGEYIGSNKRRLRSFINASRHAKTPVMAEWRSTLARADLNLEAKITRLGVIEGDYSGYADAFFEEARRQLDGKRIVIECAQSDKFIDHLAPFILITAPTAGVILLGESRLQARLQAPRLHRPYVALDDFLQFVETHSEASKAELNALAAEWRAAKRDGSTAMVLSGRDVAELSRFILQRIEEGPELSIPGQLASPLLVSIREGELVIDDESSEITELVSEADALLREIAELCADVQASAYLSNCAPGVERKLARLRSYLETAVGRSLDAGKLVQIGVVGASLKEVVRREQDNLPEYVIAECSAMFTQLDLFLVQFEPWRRYVQQGAKVDWGRESSAPLARALAQALFVVTDTLEGVDEAVRAKTGELVTITSASDVTP